MKNTLLTAALLLSFAAASLVASPALAAEGTVAPAPAASPTPTPTGTPPPAAPSSGRTSARTSPPTLPEPGETAEPAPATLLPPKLTATPSPSSPPSRSILPTPELTVSPTPTPDPAPTPDPTPPPVFNTGGGIGTKWLELKGAEGVLGEPTSHEACQAGLCVQTFKGGSIYWAWATGAHPVFLASGRTGPRWNSAGGLAVFGYPISDETSIAGRSLQKFSTGKVLIWTGQLFLPFSTGTGIGGRWAADGAETVLGLPLADESCGLKNGGCSQVFDHGTIFWSPFSGGQVIKGGIGIRWRAAGAQNGVLGYPVMGELCGQTAGGCVQRFQGGTIYWSPATGPWITRAGIGSRYSTAGADRSSLGYPLGNEVCGQAAGGCVQRFQGGSIYWSPATGPWITRAGIAGKYVASGAAGGALGYPTSNERCAAGQCIQSFERGFIGWTRSAGSRVYAVTECQKLNNGQSRYPTYGASRVLLTFTQGYGLSRATNIYCVKMAGTYVPDWKTDGYVGASGFKAPGVPSGPTRNLFSPTGSYSVTEAFGLGSPGTKLAYRTLSPRSRWGGNPWTSTYNKYFDSSSWVGWDENMWYFATRSTHDYRQGVVVNYNRPGIVQNAGFAIFLHMNKVPTAGCISLDDWAVVDYIRKSTPGDRIIMGTYKDLFR
ncbi:hypothetical protein V3C33_14885 [Micrococcaceae bacterium Sec5.7]